MTLGPGTDFLSYRPHRILSRVPYILAHPREPERLLAIDGVGVAGAKVQLPVPEVQLRCADVVTKRRVRAERWSLVVHARVARHLERPAVHLNQVVLRARLAANVILWFFTISLLPANAQQIFVSAGFGACPKGSVYLENGFCKAETGKQYVPAGLFNSCPSGFEFALSRYCASK